MAQKIDSTLSVQEPYMVPDCGCGSKECFGPDPVPWLSWKHCFKFYEFRHGVIPFGGAQGREQIIVRIRYEHSLCLLGRKQGPIVHSLTLLPQEELRIYEYDRYRSATSSTSRFSARSSFYTLTQQVHDNFSRTEIEFGVKGSVEASTTTTNKAGLSIPFLANASTSTTNSLSGEISSHFDVSNVSQTFSHVAQTSSQAVEVERSITVSTVEDRESVNSSARLLRNDNNCRAVTYYIRRVFEVYQLSTRIVSIEVQVGKDWVPLSATSKVVQEAVKKNLQKIEVGLAHDPKVEIALPTDGLLYEAELAHCCSCECEREVKHRLEMERFQLENLNMRLEADRRQKRLEAGDLDSFDQAVESTPVPASPGP